MSATVDTSNRTQFVHFCPPFHPSLTLVPPDLTTAVIPAIERPPNANKNLIESLPLFIASGANREAVLAADRSRKTKRRDELNAEGLEVARQKGREASARYRENNWEQLAAKQRKRRANQSIQKHGAKAHYDRQFQKGIDALIAWKGQVGALMC
ncbi:hypothetical protein K438DRAFT_1957171 [Mycena galopus ATCC 62051]|nr:hypothetical protein K438DRAFT_1957171 [Mycena galopus ATCC 62051]